MPSEWPKITKEQADVAFKFLEVLFNDNVDEFWDMICKVDQARVYGMYRQIENLSPVGPETFREYIKDIIKPDFENIYEKLRDNSPGVSQTLRHSEAGDALLYLFEDVQVSRTYIAETEALVFPLTLTLDANYRGQEIVAEWKVRLYVDYLYQKLDQEL